MALRDGSAERRTSGNAAAPSVAASPEAVDVPARRDELIEELKKIYEFAPDTSSKAYRAAQRALQISEDMTFTNDEINKFLPDSLHV